MKPILLFFNVLLLGFSNFNSSVENFNFKSDIEFLQSSYCNYALGFSRVNYLVRSGYFVQKGAYSKLVENGVIDESITSVFDTINSQTKYYDKYNFTLKYANLTLNPSQKIPLLFRKLNNGKVSLSINFVQLENFPTDLGDKELIDLFIDKHFEDFKMIMGVNTIDEKDKTIEISRIGISYIYCYGDKTIGIAIYINKKDIKDFDEGKITKQQLIALCNVYKLTDKFRLIQ